MNLIGCFYVSAIAALATSSEHEILPPGVCDSETGGVTCLADLMEWERKCENDACKQTVVDTFTMIEGDPEVCYSSDGKEMAINVDASESQFTIIGLTLAADQACGKTYIFGLDGPIDCANFVRPDDSHQVLDTVTFKTLSDSNTFDYNSTPLPIHGSKSIFVSASSCTLETSKHKLTLKLGTGETPTAGPSESTAADNTSAASTQSDGQSDGIGSAIATATVVSAVMAYLSL